MPNIFRTGRPIRKLVQRSTKSRRPASATSAVASKVKGQGRKVRWRVDRCLLISREQNVLETTKLEKKQFHTPRAAVSRSKVKVTRSTNAETGSASYLPNGKAYQFQTWYTDGVRRPVSPTSAVTRPITAETETVSYLLKVKTYELQNW